MKKILLVLAALTMQCHAVADSPYEESVKDLLQDYNYSKDKAVASVVLVRCAALINMTNMVSQVPEQLQIDPNELFVSSIAMRTSNPSREEASSTIAEFKEFSAKTPPSQGPGDPWGGHGCLIFQFFISFHVLMSFND